MRGFKAGAIAVAAIVGGTAFAEPIVYTGVVSDANGPASVIYAGLPSDWVHGRFTLTLSPAAPGTVVTPSPSGWVDSWAICKWTYFRHGEYDFSDRYYCAGGTYEPQGNNVYGRFDWMEDGRHEVDWDWDRYFYSVRESRAVLEIHPFLAASANYTLTLYQAVPEASAWSLMLVGFAGIGTAVRFRPRRAATTGRRA